MIKNYSRTSTNGHLSTTASFFVLGYGPYIVSYFNLSPTATSPQRQPTPLKYVPTAKITS